MSTSFGLYSRYYDLLYRDKDYVGETAYVIDLIKRFNPTTRDVLEFGCGTGKHAELLAKSGLNVTGIERSDEMIGASRSVHPNLKILSGDARSVRLDQAFDTVLALFHVVSYQITNQDVAGLFESAATHLKAGGCFLFDVWYGPAVLRQLPEPRTRNMQDDRINVDRVAQPSIDFRRNVVDVEYRITVTDKVDQSVQQLTENHNMRYFFEPEIDLFAVAAGMSVVHSEQWMDGAEASPDTWGVTFVLRKN